KRIQTEKLLGNIKNLPLIPKMMFEVTKFLQSPAPTTSGLARLNSFGCPVSGFKIYIIHFTSFKLK
ncbi:MAG TPA: hypothetical protein VHO43_16520, partial [Ignavibacteriales bacterium]|nr:hypothetical protein [Ignavibacteriales bacterium]